MYLVVFQDASGCEVCECAQCDDITCANYCPHGYVRDDRGCRVKITLQFTFHHDVTHFCPIKSLTGDVFRLANAHLLHHLVDQVGVVWIVALASKLTQVAAKSVDARRIPTVVTSREMGIAPSVRCCVSMD